MLLLSVPEICYGETYFSNGLPFTKQNISFTNSFSNTVIVTARFNELSDASMPLSVELTKCDELKPTGNVTIESNQTVALVMIIAPNFNDESKMPQYTSFVNIRSIINIPFILMSNDSDDSSNSQSVSLNINASLCSSILFVDVSDNDFPLCEPFEEVVKEFQVWNRSECELEYSVDCLVSLNPSLVKATVEDIGCVAVLEEVESGLPIAAQDSLCIVPFASQRLRIKFSAKEVGDYMVSVIVCNRHNPGNKVVVEADVVVKEQEVSAQEELLPSCLKLFAALSNTNVFAGSQAGAPLQAVWDSGQQPCSFSFHSMEIGDCYTGVKKFQRCWLHNSSDRPLEVRVLLPCDDRDRGWEQEVLMDGSKHIPDESVAYSGLVQSFSAALEEVGGELSSVGDALVLTNNILNQHLSADLKVAEEAVPLPVVDAPPVESVSVLKSSKVVTRSRNVSFSSTISTSLMDDSDQPVVILEPDCDVAPRADATVSVGIQKSAKPAPPLLQQVQKEKLSTSGGGVVVFDSPEMLHDKLAGWENVQKAATVGSKSGSLATSYANDFGVICGRVWGDAGLCRATFGEEDCADTYSRFLTPQNVLGGKTALEGGGVSCRRFFLGKAVKQSKSRSGKGVSKKSTPITLVPTVPMADVLSQPNSLEELGASAAMSDGTSVSTAVVPSGESNGGTLHTVTEQALSDDSLNLGMLCLSVVVLAPGERRPCTLVLIPSSGESCDEEGNGSGDIGALVAKTASVVFRSREILNAAGAFAELRTCQLSLHMRVCTSLVSVSPLVYDLGLCSVGDFRSVTFDVQNESDLPALVYSFVQSETLGILEPELLIPPRKSKQLKVEYVAHSENTLYNKKAVVLNVHNPKNHNQVEIRAKNVDTQQILLHSLFYKLATFNNKRQLQVYFDKGLVNMPNLKTFCLQNLWTQTLRVEIVVERNKCLQVFLLRSWEEVTTSEAEAPATTKTVPVAAVGSKSGKHPRFNDFSPEDFLDSPSESANRKTLEGDHHPVPSNNSSVAGSAMNKDIEDLKWGGDESEDCRLLRISKSASMRMGGLDSEFHMTRSEKLSLSNHVPLSSDLNALDVMVSSAAVPSVPSMSKAVSNLDLAALAISSSKNTLLLDSKSPLLDAVSGGASRLSPKVSGEAKEIGAIGGSASTVGRYLDLIHDLDKNDFPFTLLDTYSSAAAALQDGETTDYSLSNQAQSRMRADSSSQRQQDVDKHIKAIQRAYADFKSLVDNRTKPNSCLVPLQELQPEASADNSLPNEAQKSTRTFVVEVPVNGSLNFAVILFPQQTESLEECHQITISENIQIRLPLVTVDDISAALKANTAGDTDAADAAVKALSSAESGAGKEDLITAGPLKPRSILIRARASRCDMIAIQKNISFGRTLVGEKTSRVVTVVNRSSVPCLYSISKSGSISSSFLQIPEGRNGVIPAFSTKHIEFIFKPSLPGSFEETLHIENVLNPRNTQTIVIKAKVSKTESFALSPHLTTKLIATIPKVPSGQDLPVLQQVSPAREQVAVPLSAVSDAELFFRAQLDEALAHISSASAPGESASVASLAVFPAQQLGQVAVGDQCESVIQFRIKNLTSKRRQFIVDATHPTSIELLASAVLASREKILHHSSPPRRKLLKHRSKSLAHLTADDSPYNIPFEPIPEVLQSIVGLCCKFSSVAWTSDKVGKGQVVTGAEPASLSEEQRLALEDSLEKFQQKLKIALRKNKTEKIDKYQKKINRVIAALTGIKDEAPASATTEATDGVAAISNNTEGSNNTESYVAVETQSVSAEAQETVLVTASKSGAEERFSSAVVEESGVTFHFSLDPDQEKVVTVRVSILPGVSYSQWMGVLPFVGSLRVFESRNEDLIKCVHFGALIYSSRVSLSASAEEVGAEESLHSAGKRTGLLPSPIADKAKNRLSLASISELQKVESSFLVTVAQWSSLQTKLVHPKYRLLPQNVLGMSVKLVQASKDRVMYGALSLSSLLVERDASVEITVEDNFPGKFSTEYLPYNAQVHGLISFGLASTGSAGSENDLASYDTVNRDETVMLYHNTSIKAQFVAGGQLLFVVKWQPSAEEVRGAVNLLGALRVRCSVKDTVVGTEQFVPFICVRDHKSVLKVDRHFTFGDISVGSYRMAAIPIHNTSTSEDLHYLVSSEELPVFARPAGKLQINGGQTGVIPPSSSRTLSLLFSATATGKFEQRLWVRNISDGFDQKRITIQANATITQAKFVTFPDLEHSLDALEGKYKAIELGFIQIQAIADPSLLTLPALDQLPQDDFYELRIENVSDKDLSVTAISNLKSQCFVYCDKQCSRLAVNSLLPRLQCTSLFILIRPTPLSSRSADWMSSSKQQSSATSLAASTVSGISRSSSANGTESAAPVSEGGAQTHAGRELKGGIRLLFFAVEPSLAAPDAQSSEDSLNVGMPFNTQRPVVESSQRKLFETAISFRATVGKSRLRLKSVTPTLRRVQVEVREGVRGVREVWGQFEVKNDSTSFPLRYAYLLDDPSDCCGEALDCSTSFVDSWQEAGRERSSGLKLKVLDSFVNVLQPGETRVVHYCLLFSCDTVTQMSDLAGLVLHAVQLVNLSTKDVCTLRLGLFFDVCSIVTDETITALSAEEGKSVVAEHLNSNFQSMLCDSPVWLAGLDGKTRSLRQRQRRRKDPEEEGFVASDGESESVASSENNLQQLWYEVTGSAVSVLSSTVIRNTHTTKSLTLTPVSDLPVAILCEILQSDCASLPTLSKAAGDTPNPKPVGKWRRNLYRRGEPFTLPPQSAARVSVTVRKGFVLEEGLVDDLQRAKLEAGALCKLHGVICFMQSAHSLQSLFERNGSGGSNSKGVAAVSSADPGRVASPPLLSMFSPPPPSKARDTESGTEPPNKPPLFPALWNAPPSPLAPLSAECSSSMSRFEVLPVQFMVKVSCCFVVPKLVVPQTVFALGKLRSGFSAAVDLLVDNISEVDVPCSMECLPSWLALLPSNFSEEGTFQSPTADSLSCLLLRDDGESESFGVSKEDGIGEREPLSGSDKRGKSFLSSAGSKKMKMWFQDVAPETDVLSPTDSVSFGGLSDLTSLLNHQRKFAVTEDDFYCGSPPPKGESECGVEEEDEVLSDTSLHVNHQSVIAASMIDALAMEREVLPPRHRVGTVLFVARKSARTVIRLVAKAPYVESQKMEHKIRVKNLAGYSSPYSTGWSDFEFLVRMEVDSNRVVDVTGGANEPLVTSLNRNSGETAMRLTSQSTDSVSEASLSPTRRSMCMATSSTSQSAVLSAGAVSYRLIKEPFLVPPPVVPTASELTDSTPREQGGNNGETLPWKFNPPVSCEPAFFRSAFKVSPEAKVYCSLFLKNNTNKSVSISTSLTLNPAVARVLEMQLKFQASSEGVLMLMPKETAEIKVRLTCRMGSRFEDIDLRAAAGYLLNSAGDGVASAALLGAKDDSAWKPPAEGRPADSNVTKKQQQQPTSSSSLRFGSCGPILLGSICLRPAVQNSAEKSQSKGRERSVSFEVGNTATPDNAQLSTQPSSASLEAGEESNSFVAQQDVLVVDVVGYFAPGPTTAVSRYVQPPLQQGDVVRSNSGASDPLGIANPNALGPQNEMSSLLVFRAVEDRQLSSVGPSGAKHLRIQSGEQHFVLSNPSGTSPLNFSIKSASYRHSGMRLLLSTSDAEACNSEEGYYDTIKVQASPARGTIPPGCSAVIAVSVTPGNPGSSIRAASTVSIISEIPDKVIRALARGELVQQADGADEGGSPKNDSVLACMCLMVRDEDWPQHPPRRVFSYLTCDSAVEELMAVPVSDTKRSNQNSDEHDMEPVVAERVASAAAEVDGERNKVAASRRPTSAGEDVPEAEATKPDSLPVLRLRGVTPSAAKTPGRYSIDLKQQAQKKEGIEWLLSVENCGAAMSVPFTVATSDQSWLSFGQSVGSVSSSGTTEIMLYFSRASVGVFSAFVVVRNQLNRGNDLVVLVTMEVVSADAGRKGSSAAATLTPPVASSPTDEAAAAAGNPSRVELVKNTKVYPVRNLFKLYVAAVLDKEAAASESGSGEAVELDLTGGTCTDIYLATPAGDIHSGCSRRVFRLMVENCCDMPLDLRLTLHSAPLTVLQFCLLSASKGVVDGEEGFSAEVSVAPRTTCTLLCVAQLENAGAVVDAVVRASVPFLEDQSKTTNIRVHIHQ